MKISDQLKTARAALGLSQKQIAEQSGVSTRGYQGYEDGRSIPGGEAIEGFIRVGINANWLLTGEGSMLLKEDVHTSHSHPSTINFAMEATGSGSGGSSAEIVESALHSCLSACSQTYGEDFNKMEVSIQMAYAIDLYNLLVRMSASMGGGLELIRCLEVNEIAQQLQIFKTMGKSMKFPPPLKGAYFF